MEQYLLFILIALLVVIAIFILVLKPHKNKKLDTKKEIPNKPNKNDSNINVSKNNHKKNFKVIRSSSNASSEAKKNDGNKSEEAKALRNQLKVLNTRRKAQNKLPKSVQQTIPYLAEYDNGVLELQKLKNGNYKYSICFSFEDMNYSTLKVDEAKTIFLRYVDLLNALPVDCDAFLIVNNQNVDISKLKEDIKIKDREDEFNHLRHEMNEIMETKILSGNNHLHKERYFVVTIEAANQVEAFSTFTRLEGEIINAFKRIGTRARRLDTMERFEQIHDLYRPKNVGEFGKMELDYKKLEKEFISMKDYICPDSFNFKVDHFEFGDKIARCLFINDYPTVVNDRFLSELSDVSFNVIVNVGITPIRMEDGIKLVNKQILGMEANKQEAQKKALRAGYSPDMINHNLQTSLSDAETLRDDVLNQNQKLFEVSLLIMHIADTKEQLDIDTKAITSIASKHLCQIRKLDYQQEQALNQAMPFGNNLLPIKRTLTTEATAIFMPFLSQELMQKDGFYYGMNALSGNLIYLNRLHLMNANGFTLGASGSGKSFSAKREMLNILLNTDDEVIVIDPDGEYVPFLKGLGGEHIEVSPISDNHLNPMDMDKDYNIDENGKVGDPIIAKSDFILALCEEAIGDEGYGINAVQKAFIDTCVRASYKKYIESGFNKKYQPTFKDLQMEFDKIAALPDEIEVAKAFTLYSNGSLDVFAHQTNINIKKRFVGYDISKLGKSLNIMGQLIMLDNVWNHVLENRKKGIRTWLYCDEFTVLLRRNSSKVFFLDTYKRIRKMGGACTGITQNITSLLRDDDAVEMLANAEFIYLLNQSPSDRVQLANILGMSETQLQYVSDVDKGCGLIKASRHIIPFNDKFPKDTELYEMMTTDPEERKKIDKLGEKK